MAERISAAEFERQAAEYTGEAVEQLNAAVRAQPALGARSGFFQDPANVARGLPVFQGKHTRFVYDDDEEEIVAAVDVTQEALHDGPRVRTVAELDADIDGASDEEEDDDYDDIDEEEEEEEEEEEDETGVHNEFYVPEGEDNDEEMAMDDAQVSALLQDIEMELAAVAIDQRQLLARASAATSGATPAHRPETQ
jgi:hypothetical protein